MSNELLFLLCAMADILFVLFAARRGVEWLLGTVAMNLILVGIFGAKLILIFGLLTNAGNIFYACVFLATYFILEKHGKRVGQRTVLYGIVFSIFFLLMSQFAIRFTGASLSTDANDAIQHVVSFSLRVTVASVLAFVFAQYVNIFVYEWLRTYTKGKHLWLRSNGANVVSQLVDSLLFFSIAFVDLSGPLLVQSILAGWLVKTLIVSLGTPFLYVDRYLEARKKL